MQQYTIQYTTLYYTILIKTLKKYIFFKSNSLIFFIKKVFLYRTILSSFMKVKMSEKSKTRCEQYRYFNNRDFSKQSIPLYTILQQNFVKCLTEINICRKSLMSNCSINLLLRPKTAEYHKNTKSQNLSLIWMSMQIGNMKINLFCLFEIYCATHQILKQFHLHR